MALLNSINDTCTLLGVGRNTVYNLIGAGKLLSVKVGDRRLIPQASIENFVQQLADEAAKAQPETPAAQRHTDDSEQVAAMARELAVAAGLGD